MKILVILISSIVAFFVLAPVALAQDGTSAVALVDLLNNNQAWFVMTVAGVLGSMVTNLAAKIGFIPASLTDETRRYVMTATGIIIPAVGTVVFAYLYDLAAVLDAQGYTALIAAAVSVAYGTHRLGKGQVSSVASKALELATKYAPAPPSTTPKK